MRRWPSAALAGARTLPSRRCQATLPAVVAPQGLPQPLPPTTAPVPSGRFRQPLWATGRFSRYQRPGKSVHDGPIIMWDPEDVLFAVVATTKGLTQQQLWEAVRGYHCLSPVPIFRSKSHFQHVLKDLRDKQCVEPIPQDLSEVHKVSKGAAQARPQTKEELLLTQRFRLTAVEALWATQWERHWGAPFTAVLPPPPDSPQYREIQRTEFERWATTGDFEGMSARELDALPMHFLDVYAATRHERMRRNPLPLRRSKVPKSRTPNP